MESTSNNITYVIFTFNEERRIERILKNLQGAGKILLNDDGSTDRTHEIALSYGADIMIREGKYAFLEDQTLLEAIYKKVDTEWIFWFFADEMLDKQTINKVSEVIACGKYDVIDIFRKNYFYGEFCNKFYQSSTPRIFKKGALTFVGNKIHGMGKPTVSNDRVCKLPDKYFIHQFMDYTASIYLNKTNVYTETEIKFHAHPNKTLMFLLLRIAKNFIKDYFFNKGYKIGFPGLAITELSLMYELVKNIKVYENANNINRATIEEKNNVHRDLILKEFNSI